MTPFSFFYKHRKLFFIKVTLTVPLKEIQNLIFDLPRKFELTKANASGDRYF